MISKVILGKSFKGCCKYVCTKSGSEILFAEGVRIESITQMVSDFRTIQGQKPNLLKPVIHTSVSFAYSDKEKMSSELMISVAKKYITKLGLDNNQMICVRHNDAKHDHFHLIINRVDYEGRATSDSFIKNRAARACDELEVEFGLTVARGQSMSTSIKHKSPIKNMMRAVVKSAVHRAIGEGITTISELEANLSKSGIEMQVHYQKTGRINGLSFRWNNVSMKGSAIDKSLSYKRLAKGLGNAPGNHIESILNKQNEQEYE